MSEDLGGPLDPSTLVADCNYTARIELAGDGQ